MNTWNTDIEVRNEHLSAGLHAAQDPMCDVTVWCDSSTSRVTRFTMLIRSHARRYGKDMGRIPCPKCKAGAWWMLHRPEDDDEPERTGLWGHLLHPFRRDEDEDDDMTVFCVVCSAYEMRDGAEEIKVATHVIDGNSVCDEHGHSMLSVIAGRLPAREGT